MTFFKHIFRIWSVPLLLLLMAKNFAQRKFRTGLQIFLFFCIGPVLYSIFFSLPRCGIYNYDLMSGRLMFANMARYTNCGELAESFPDSTKRATFQDLCDEKLVDLLPKYHLFHPGSIVGLVKERFLSTYNEAEQNRFFQLWSLRLVAAHPRVALGAMNNNFRGHIYGALGALSYGSHPSWGFIENVAPNLFGMSPDEFITGWNKFLTEHARPIRIVDWVSMNGLRALRLIGLIWLLALVPLTFWRRREFAGSILIGGLAFIYGLAILIVNYFEPRANVLLDYLLWLSFGLGLVPLKKEWELLQKK